MVMYEKEILRFHQAAALLPPEQRRALERLDDAVKARTEEIRLRAGQPVSLVLPEGEITLPGWERPVRTAELALLLEIATQASAHTALSQVRSGFFTVRGGHRLGICGSGVVKDGAVWNLRQVSSLALRIAREAVGIAAPILDRLWAGEELLSTLILSPPGWGKTTLLRDLIRALSDGDGVPARRVGVADERGELAGVCEGVPQFRVGRRTDVMDGCPKSAGLLMLLRGMNPQALAADEITAPEDIAYTRRQYDILCAAVEEMAARGCTFAVKHCCNSAGTFAWPEFHLDMVRPGIILYGEQPSADTVLPGLVPALRLRAAVSMVKELAAGDAVSYGCTFRAPKPMRAATLAVGYADGYPRALSGRGTVSLHGRPARVLGRVCMDQIVVDVTDIPDVKAGDAAIVFGGGAADSVDDVARMTGTINYEVLCDVGRRVQRVYVENGAEVELVDYLKGE